MERSSFIVVGQALLEQIGKLLNRVVLLVEHVRIVNLDTVSKGVFGVGQVVTFGHFDIAADGNRSSLGDLLLSLLRQEIVNELLALSLCSASLKIATGLGTINSS